jgi:putative isomerase
MRLSNRPLIFAMAAFALALAASAHAQVANYPITEEAHYLDVLDLHGLPKTATDRSFNIFFDAGSWHGYSLPLANDASTGFSGPFVHSVADGQWAGVRFAQLVLQDVTSHQAINLVPIESHAAPGYLFRRFSAQLCSLPIHGMRWFVSN